ncbi:MAG TPA: SPFH domain-containing protein [Nitrospiria bacterium]|jgi:regulator of protease activity HflC (stomatin/prohibitin superfamily)
MNTGLIIAAIILLIFLVFMFRIVPEYQRIVILRLGRVLPNPKGPGIVIVIPIIDVAIRVDLREKFFEIPQQTCITKDNAPISIDFLIYSRVTDPTSSVIQVQDFAGASQGIATTTLRAVVGDIPLDDVLARRDQINRILQSKMDEVTQRWGVKITGVEIREITPPKEVQDAMTRQMSAERARRATVTEAEGQKQAAIAVAEGVKQSDILKAEGERQAAILRSEGFALALGKIFEVARGVDEKTLSLQYLETLKSLGSSPSTKFIFPMEFSNMLNTFLDSTKKSFKKE